MSWEFISVGAAATNYGNPASVTPTLVGHVEGDLLLLAAFISGVSLSGTPAGYTELVNVANRLALFGKIAGASESAPTITGESGSAPLIAQMACGRFGADTLEVLASATLETPEGVVDIPTPELLLKKRYPTVIAIGGKEGANGTATLAAGLSTFTKVGDTEFNSTADLNLVWGWYEQGYYFRPFAAGSFNLSGVGTGASYAALVGLKGPEGAQRAATRL